MKYIQQLSRQLALDYCCTPADILDQGNHFTEYRSLEGRRRFEDQDNCALKITAVNRKLIFTGKKEIIELCCEKYETCPGAWFMDVGNFRELDHILKPYGCQLKQHIRFSCRRQRVLQKKRGLRSEHMTVGRSCSLQGTTGLTRHSALTKNHPICWEWQRFQTERSSAWRGQAQIVLCSGRSGSMWKKRRSADISRPLWSQF